MTYYQEVDDEYKTIKRLSQKLINASANQIVLNIGDNTISGVHGVKRKLQYINEPFQLLSDHLSYTFELHNKELEVSLQIYENINSHYRINCFSNYGSASGCRRQVDFDTFCSFAFYTSAENNDFRFLIR